MSFRMRLHDLFRLGDKTIFTGLLEADERVISKVRCVIEIDGLEYARVDVEGEVYTGTSHRDLWTKSRVNLDRGVLTSHQVWLISA
jgi:hypothetical protein